MNTRERNTTPTQQSRVDHAILAGVIAAAAQIVNSVLQYPFIYKLPAILIVAMGCIIYFMYVNRKLGTTNLVLSVVGTVTAIVLFISFARGDPDPNKSIGDDSKHYYLKVVVFGDENSDGIKDGFEKPLGNIKVLVQNSQHQLSTYYTDIDGQVLVDLSRHDDAVLIACGLSQEHFVDRSWTTPALAHLVMIGISPSQLEFCAKP